MKAMTIEVPREGASVQLFFRGSMSFGQAVIVLGDDVDIYRENAKPEANGAAVESAPASPAAAPEPKSADKSKVDFDAIYASLIALRTKKRSAAVNVIKTMFQFTNPITTQTAERILRDLARRGYLNVNSAGFLEYLEQKEVVGKD